MARLPPLHPSASSCVPAAAPPPFPEPVCLERSACALRYFLLSQLSHLPLFSSPPRPSRASLAALPASVYSLPPPSSLPAIPSLPRLPAVVGVGQAAKSEGAGSRVSPRVAKAGTGWRLKERPPPSFLLLGPRRLQKQPGRLIREERGAAGTWGGNAPPDLEQQHEVK